MANFYIFINQPTTCPICGARADMISNLYHTNLKLQISECLNFQCKHVVLEVED